MDNRAIGVFDSGLGGLTAVKEIWHSLPYESIIYFGDTGRVPYGTRSKETVIRYALQDMDFLLSYDIKAVVAACGTVSSVALSEIRSKTEIPVFDVVTPASKSAVNITKTGNIGVIGTTATISSHSFSAHITSKNKDITVHQKACPMLVPLVENGYIDKNNAATNIITREYLQYFNDKNIDTLILGCTHYPILSDIIKEILGNGVTLIDSGKEAVKRLFGFLNDNKMLSENTQPYNKFFVSDDAANFSSIASIFLEKEIKQQAQVVNLEI